jgi:hypothetical protein
MSKETEMMNLLMEAGIAGLQLWFAYCREAGLNEEEKQALYAQVDAQFMEKVKQNLPDA